MKFDLSLSRGAVSKHVDVRLQNLSFSYLDAQVRVDASEAAIVLTSLCCNVDWQYTISENVWRCFSCYGLIQVNPAKVLNLQDRLSVSKLASDFTRGLISEKLVSWIELFEVTTDPIYSILLANEVTAQCEAFFKTTKKTQATTVDLSSEGVDSSVKAERALRE